MEPKNENFLDRPNPTPPILVAVLGVTTAFLTFFDLLATVFRLFAFRFVALAILNVGVFLLNVVLLYLAIAASGGRPPSRCLASGGGAAEFLVYRTYALAKRAVFLIGVLIVLLMLAEPHLDRFVSPT